MPSPFATLQSLVERNDANATRIWLEHAKAMRPDLEGAARMPLYRCFRPRTAELDSCHQLNAPLLLVGINPATPAARAHWVNKEFVWHGVAPAREALSRLKDYEVSAETAYKRHFGRYSDLCLRAFGSEHQWAHLDMFLVRNSSQAEVTRCLWNGARAQKTLRPFFAEQFEQFKWTLKAHQPQVVAIMNRGASNIAKREMMLEPIEDVQPGDYALHRWDQMPEVPFVLGSMLTGKGALKPEPLNLLVAAIQRGEAYRKKVDALTA